MLRDLWDDVREMWFECSGLERIVLAIWVPIYAIAWVLGRLFDFDL